MSIFRRNILLFLYFLILYLYFVRTIIDLVKINNFSRMEYIAPTVGTVGRILCCECGIPIEPNPTNTCVTCLRQQTDITHGIPRSSVVNFCKGCERYLQPPAAWIRADLESRELLRALGHTYAQRSELNSETSKALDIKCANCGYQCSVC